VICSHFHPDHIGRAADFTRARYIYSAEGYEELRQRTRWGRVRAGFLAKLLPQDFEQRALALRRDQLRTQVSDLRDFHDGFDLFGDGSVVIVELPGHAVGQLGAVIRESRGKNYLLAGDACWLKESYQRDIPPPDLVMNLLFDDKKAYVTTLRRIHEFSKAYPGFRIVPGHCPDRLRELAG
jgi:glyoxylase-like metal-dependent hydrolase (beta-lactamase superfamily II)